MTKKALVPFIPRQVARPASPIQRHFTEMDRIGTGIDQNGDGSGIYYRCAQTDRQGHLFERVDDPGFTETFTHEQIAELEQTPGWRYDRDFFKPQTAEDRLKTKGAEFIALPAAQRKRMLFWQIICDSLLALFASNEVSKSDEGIQRGLKIIFEKNGHVLDTYRQRKHPDGLGLISYIPTPRRVRDQLTLYVNSGRNPFALADNYQYNHDRSSLPLDVQAILFTIALQYATKTKPTYKALMERLQRAIKDVNVVRRANGLEPFTCPDIDALKARIDALGAFYVLAGREGQEKAQKHFVEIFQGLTITRPGERIEMDFWKVNIFTRFIRYSDLWLALSPEQREEIDKKRWMLCLALDCASRYVLGMRLAPTENADTAVATLEMVMTDKTKFGLAAGAATIWKYHTGCPTLNTDQGSAFIAERFRTPCAVLGIRFINPPAGIPYHRGCVERIFRTIDLQAFNFLIGRCFENVAAKGDADPDVIKCLSVEQLAAVLVLFFLDKYHNEEHAGLGGETPENCFPRLLRQYGSEPAPGPIKLRHAFGVRLERTITARGVRVLNLHFNSPALADYFRHVGDGHKVEVILGLRDMGFVSVQIGREGYIEVPCVMPELHGVTAVVWMMVCQDLTRRFAHEAIASQDIILDAIQKIIDIGEAARIEANIASPIITKQEVDRLEYCIEIPQRSREAAKANPDAGGDFLDDLIPSTATGNYTPPAPVPSPQKATPSPSKSTDFDPETGEIQPSNQPEDDGEADLPDGWSFD